MKRTVFAFAKQRATGTRALFPQKSQKFFVPRACARRREFDVRGSRVCACRCVPVCVRTFFACPLFAPSPFFACCERARGRMQQHGIRHVSSLRFTVLQVPLANENADRQASENSSLSLSLSLSLFSPEEDPSGLEDHVRRRRIEGTRRSPPPVVPLKPAGERVAARLIRVRAEKSARLIAAPAEETAP